MGGGGGERGKGSSRRGERRAGGEVKEKEWENMKIRKKGEVRSEKERKNMELKEKKERKAK